MKRRTFLKSTCTVGLFTMITPTGFIQALGQNTLSDLEDSFKQPPMNAWPHWMNGHVLMPKNI
jgi:hypothetical protein